MFTLIKSYMNYIIIGVIVVLLLACAWLYASKAGVEADLKDVEAKLEIAKDVIKKQKDDNTILTSANESKAKEIELLYRQAEETNQKMAELAEEKLRLQKRLQHFLEDLPPVVVGDNCTLTQKEQENSVSRLNLLWTDYCSTNGNDPYCMLFMKTKGETK